mgnify:CR=1 FL=1
MKLRNMLSCFAVLFFMVVKTYAAENYVAFIGEDGKSIVNCSIQGQWLVSYCNLNSVVIAKNLTHFVYDQEGEELIAINDKGANQNVGLVLCSFMPSMTKFEGCFSKTTIVMGPVSAMAITKNWLYIANKKGIYMCDQINFQCSVFSTEGDVASFAALKSEYLIAYTHAGELLTYTDPTSRKVSSPKRKATISKTTLPLEIAGNFYNVYFLYQNLDHQYQIVYSQVNMDSGAISSVEKTIFNEPIDGGFPSGMAVMNDGNNVIMNRGIDGEQGKKVLTVRIASTGLYLNQTLPYSVKPEVTLTYSK